jgi:molybdate transport system ATP-binding protein
LLDVSVRKKLGGFSLDVNFSLSGTGVTVLFGESGAGKTTVINLIAGLLRPDGGKISCGGRFFFDSEKNFSLPTERRGLGVVFQQHRLFSHMSVKNNLMFGLRFCGRADDEKFREKVIAVLGISHLMERRTKSLSGGESQRVAIGRAIISNPALLLMDEPMSSLDMERKEDLTGYISSVNKRLGVPVLYVTHSIGELRALADDVLEIRGGKSAPPRPRDEFLRAVPEKI